jgi:hypothetical protein
LDVDLKPKPLDIGKERARGEIMQIAVDVKRVLDKKCTHVNDNVPSSDLYNISVASLSSQL